MVSNAPRPTASSVVFAALALAVLLLGCTSLPPSRYGVEEVEFDGVEQVSESDVSRAIATEERDSFLFWVWPWTDWPLFDNTVFERDVARIERWYRARGYYHAKVTGAEVEPRAAIQSDRIPLPTELEDGQSEPCERIDDDEGCSVSVKFTVEEGEPVLVHKVTFVGVDGLPQSVRDDLQEAVLLIPEERFDEALYDESKRQVKRALGSASYARAQVEGAVKINPATNAADIEFSITPGPTCTLGKITVAGNEELPADIILLASYLETGDAYDTAALEEANRAIAALGAFSAVSVEPQIPPEDDPSSVIDIVLKVTPGKLFTLGVGIGVQNGTMEFGDQQAANSEWDIHLLSFLEDRNFLGGFRKFRIEERPRLIFPAAFPGGVSSPKPGNEFKLEFRQPDFFEARTTLVAAGEWDYGPDPNVPATQIARPFRHEIGGRVGPERSFFDGHLFLQLALRATLYLPDEGSIAPSSYHALFFEEHIGIDFRDNPTEPTRGVYLGSNFEQSAFYSSWTFFRAVPEVRGYLPLSDDLVLAGRFSIGWMKVTPEEDLSQFDEFLGPRILRFRSGGANSNRGYPANTVGASRHAGNGGLREWESSLEFRYQIDEDWGLVMFADASDVDDGCVQNCVQSIDPATGTFTPLRDLDPTFKEEGTTGASYRWDHLHLSVGMGVRLKTPIGPFRLDVGFQVPGMQWPKGSPEDLLGPVEAPLLFGLIGPDVPMAWHFSFGEAF